MKLNRCPDIPMWLAISLITSVVVCVVFYKEISFTGSDQINEVLKTLITLFGTLLGFVLTLMAIVISLIDKRMIKNMVESGNYSNLLQSSKTLSLLFFLSIAIFLIALMFEKNQSYAYLLSIAMTVIVAVFSLRTAYKFFQIFKHIESSS